MGEEKPKENIRDMLRNVIVEEVKNAIAVALPPAIEEEMAKRNVGKSGHLREPRFGAVRNGETFL